jgi:hypothetical protein
MIAQSLDNGNPDIVNPQLFSLSDEDPSKNPLCPHYDSCLNVAAKENWPQFTCQACGFHSFRTKIKPDAREMMAYYRLLHKIFMG